jgi:hypothetical protein
MASQKGTISLVKQGKFKVHSCSPSWKDGLGCLLLKTIIFVFIKWASLVMSAGANPKNFWQIWSYA